MRSCIERAFQRLHRYCAKRTNCDNCHFVTSNGDCALNITEALLKAISEVGGSPLSEWDTVGVVSLVANQSAADVAPVRRGQWNWVHRLKGGFEHYTGREANPGTEYPETYTIRRDERREVDDPYCPFCGKWNESIWLNFCPNCGADMREVPNDD